MNRIFIQIGISLLLTIILVVEKSLYGTFGLFNILQLSLVGILILVNLKTPHTFVWILFIYGLFLDVLNHTFIGVSSLVLCASLYLFYTFQIRFDKNKIFIGFINLIFTYILAISWLGFKSVFDLEVGVITFTSFVVSAIWWFRFKR